MHVELVLEKLSEDENGNEVISYKFRPVRRLPQDGKGKDVSPLLGWFLRESSRRMSADSLELSANR